MEGTAGREDYNAGTNVAGDKVREVRGVLLPPQGICGDRAWGEGELPGAKQESDTI